jgi:hypothetical protein
MRSLKALPNLFVVGEGPGIITPGLMTHQILLTGFFPRFDRQFFSRGFHGCALFCILTVENDREKSNNNPRDDANYL